MTDEIQTDEMQDSEIDETEMVFTNSSLDDAAEDEEEGDAAKARLNDPDAEEKARFIASAADSLRASDIVVLDLRGLTIIADFFLVCTGKSSIQIRSIADRIEERMREQGYRKLRVEGYQEATWILLDYGDVVAHVMAAEQREFYSLEAFWSEAPRLTLDLIEEPKAAASAPPAV